jgi:hypothetical protein
MKLAALLRLLPVVLAGTIGGAMLSEAVLAQPPAQPIFANDRYRFFRDRMESFDAYPGVFRSADGWSLSRDGDPAYAWQRKHAENLTLATPYPILDAVFALAVDKTLEVVAPVGTRSAQLEGDSPGGEYYYPYYYYTHGGDIREYTRDTAQHVQWGDSVLIDARAARGSLLRRCDFARKRLREDAVVTADSVHFIPAAWEYFKISGDRALLARCWDCLWNTMRQKEREHRKSNGLWTGSPWSDNAAGFLQPEHFRHRNEAVESLYANTVAAGAWRDLAAIAETLGKPREAAACRQACTALKAAINCHLYRPAQGGYCYYRYEPTGQYAGYREDISAGMLYLFDVADAARALEYHARFHATPYGYRNVDPPLPSGEASYHGGNVWENQDAFHGWTLALLQRPDELEPFIFWHARAALPLKEWREGTINPATGLLHSNYKRVIWGAMGYTAYWTRGVFGIVYEPDGLRFRPCVPNDFGDSFRATLTHVNYRRSQLRITLVGRGTKLKQLLLDEKPVQTVRGDLVGRHDVSIRLAGK